MKALMSAHHHGAMHIPHPVHWLHEKRIGLALLIGLITLLFIGMVILASRSGIKIENTAETYPLPYPQGITYP